MWLVTDGEYLWYKVLYIANNFVYMAFDMKISLIFLSAFKFLYEFCNFS